MDIEARITVAVREAREFKNKLAYYFLTSIISMLIILTVMAYFDIATKWIMIIGLWISTGTISYLIEQCALRLDAGRAYLEMWSKDMEETIIRIEDQVNALSSPPGDWRV